MLNDLLFRLRALLHRNSRGADLDEELRFHIEHEIQKYRRSAMSVDEAKRHVRQLFGGGQKQVEEECREVRGTSLCNNLAACALQPCRDAKQSWLLRRAISPLSAEEP
jgi:hypothetical protein